MLTCANFLAVFPVAGEAAEQTLTIGESSGVSVTVDSEWTHNAFACLDDANATYGNSEEEVYLNIFVVVTATDSPVGIEMSIFGSPEGITDLIENSEPGTLVVNGVDVLQAMQADDAVGQIP